MPARALALPTPKIVTTAQKVVQLYHGPGKQPAPLELDALHARFLAAAQQDNWSGITGSDWKKVPWILWYGNSFLADQEAFMKQLHSVLVVSGNVRMWKRMIHIYLLNYGRHKERAATEQRIAEWIQQAFTQPALKDSLKVWQERDQTIGIFKDTSWLKEAALRYLSHYEAKPKPYWKAYGLAGELEAGGYSTALGRAILKQIRTRLIEKPELVESAWSYVMKDDSTPRFQLLRKELIETLLEPWGDVRPPDAVRKSILDRLLFAFKDPRFRTNTSGGWAGVSDAAMHVLRRWLAGVTIEQFFTIIDEIGKEEHWDYRRAFWKAYIRHQAVDDARVALGKEGYALARKILERDATAAAELTNANRASCVLLMRIGDLVIAEFNHNGKCRFWKSNHKGAPALTQEEYSDGMLRVEPPVCNEAFSHTGSPNYNWQRKFRDFINKHTGCHISDKDFRVR